MSAPVDVLAVMARVVADEREWGDREDAEQVSAAYSAVAELIAAGKELQAAMDAEERGPFDSVTVNRFHAADARHRAALARCGGAK